MESTEAGCASTLFSLNSAAAVTCGIMKPELSPAPGARNAGSPSLSAGFISRSNGARRFRQGAERNRQEVECERQRLAVKVSAGKNRPDRRANRSAWAILLSSPRETRADCRPPNSSRSRRRARQWARASRTAPCTCGMQRSEYASCTLLTFQVRLADLAAREHRRRFCGHQQLPGMRARAVNALVEGDVGSLQRVERKSADNVGGIGQDLAARGAAARRPASPACR